MARACAWDWRQSLYPLAAGKNIESLAVGLNVDTALFTITVAATAEEAQQLLQRVFQLDKVSLSWVLGVVPRVWLTPTGSCSTCRQPCSVRRVALHAWLSRKAGEAAALACQHSQAALQAPHRLGRAKRTRGRSVGQVSCPG